MSSRECSAAQSARQRHTTQRNTTKHNATQHNKQPQSHEVQARKWTLHCIAEHGMLLSGASSHPGILASCAKPHAKMACSVDAGLLCPAPGIQSALPTYPGRSLQRPKQEHTCIFVGHCTCLTPLQDSRAGMKCLNCSTVRHHIRLTPERIPNKRRRQDVSVGTLL